MEKNIAPNNYSVVEPGLPPPLPVYIAEKIAADIEADLLQPGTKLSEEALAAQYGVSRAPVREALRILHLEELVQIEPRRGAWVRVFSPKEISEIFEMRAMLYSLGVELFAARASDDDLAALRALSPSATELAADPETTAERFAAATQRSTTFILSKCGNQRLDQTMRKMTRQSFRHFAILAHGRQERRRETAAMAERMGTLIRARDARGAGAIAREIVEKNHAEVMRRVGAGDA
jgi:DNA-binding GntR family transcriptional regulator